MYDERAVRASRAIALRDAGELEQSCALLLQLTEEFPEDAELWYQCAWSHDRAGLEDEAVPLYHRAVETPGLSPTHRVEALLGLGSTYRVLGRVNESRQLLSAAVAEFPDHRALRVFLAMTSFDAGQQGAAFGAVLATLVDVADDDSIAEYARPLRLYADEYARSTS
jgi:predicted Zn-dependent protease